MRFSVLADFVCGFAVLDEIFVGFAVSSIPQCPPPTEIKQRFRSGEMLGSLAPDWPIKLFENSYSLSGLSKLTYFLPVFVYKQKPFWFFGSLDKLQTSVFVVLCYGFKNGCMVLACNK